MARVARHSTSFWPATACHSAGKGSQASQSSKSELKKEEDKLAQLQKDYNNGEPERRGDERNYQKYQDRVAEMKAAIARKESDIAAIKREITKLPAP